MKPWTAKFLVAIAVLVPLFFFFGAWTSDPKSGGGPFGQSAAAWAQAMGSVGAICVAIWSAGVPARERAREIREARMARAAFVADRILRARNLARFAGNVSNADGYFGGMERELRGLVDTLGSQARDLSYPEIAAMSELAAVVCMSAASRVHDLQSATGPKAEYLQRGLQSDAAALDIAAMRVRSVE